MHREFLVQRYIHILGVWNKKVNLVQPDSLKQVMDRHVRDSKQLCGYIKVNSEIVDVGSGAGFPGVILSIYGYQNVTLCENNFKKVMFLNDIKRQLNLNFNIFNDDVYNFSSVQNAPCASRDFVVVSRAFGALSKLMGVMVRIGILRAVLHKGKGCLSELTDASRSFKFRFQLRRSITSSDGVIVLLNDVMKV